MDMVVMGFEEDLKNVTSNILLRQEIRPEDILHLPPTELGHSPPGSPTSNHTVPFLCRGKTIKILFLIFFIYSDNFHLLIGVFRPLVFK